MLQTVIGWYPGRNFTLVGDGAYACQEMLADLPERVHFVGRMRGDAALYEPNVPEQPKGKRGRKPGKGPRLPSPKEAAAKADRPGPVAGGWLWQTISVLAYVDNAGSIYVDGVAQVTAAGAFIPYSIVVPSGTFSLTFLACSTDGPSIGFAIADQFLTNSAYGLTVDSSPLTSAKILGPRVVPTPTVTTINDPAVIPSATIDAQLSEAKGRINAVAPLFPTLADRVDDHPPTTNVWGYDPNGNVLIM